MAIRLRWEQKPALREWLGLPLEWVAALTARVSGWFNQERWTNLLVLGVIVIANLILLSLLVSGQINQAIALTGLILVLPLVWLIPEIGITLFLVAGANLFMNILYYAYIPGLGTGQRSLLVGLLGLVSARAIYEYLHIPREARPRVFTWFTVLLILFWVYYMGHVAYIYIFRYNTPPPDSVLVLLGIYRAGLYRYLDAQMFWIGVLPLIILLRDWRRTVRVAILIGIALIPALVGTAIEYFTPLPEFWKIVLNIRRSGESEEGYRIALPATIHLTILCFWFALYRLGFTRKIAAMFDSALLILSTFIILAIKTRIIWGAILPLLPFAILWKPPQVLVRQAWMFALLGIVGAVFLLEPRINYRVTRLITEVQQRWERNYAFGGDPRLDPSYLARIREKEVWEEDMRKRPLGQLVFGRGIESSYGFYQSLDKVYNNPRLKQVYLEKTDMHFSWLGRIHRIGYLGAFLLVLLLAGFVLRGIQVFLIVKHSSARMFVFSVVATTIVIILSDTISYNFFNTLEALPIILLWAVVEAALYWHRTGQLGDEAS